MQGVRALRYALVVIDIEAAARIGGVVLNLLNVAGQVRAGVQQLHRPQLSTDR